MKKRGAFLTAFALMFLTVMFLGMMPTQENPEKTPIPVQPLPVTAPSDTVKKVTEPKQQTWYKDKVVILNYHHVSQDSDKKYVIEPDQFKAQMTYLYENDLHPISLKEFLRFVDTGILTQENAVLITFDDGYESFYTEAYPILREFNFPAVNFVIASRLRDSVERKREQMTTPLSFQQVEEMRSSGLIEVASHTYSLHEQQEKNEWGELKAGTEPVYLEDLQRLENDDEYRNRLYVDFMMSRVALEDWLGESMPAISLPHGYSSKTVLDVAKEAGFEYVFNSNNGVVKPGVNPYGIPRFDVGLREVGAEELAELFTSAKTE
ncbi:polysaccharide deacetylase family protein [Brevibacillus dissolubilis]|uniref:polysaccharide deacetylase family protein n=1 Tax=Brevibacillus dissolubilis TaxID=1844116 RepID=UPI0020FFFC9F|nr:polysaccharide deacetylase family protein [Brevibacillus dissolubilis]